MLNPPTSPTEPPPTMPSQHTAQDPQKRTQGLSDDLRRHEAEDNNRDMKDGDKVGSHLVPKAGPQS